MKKLDNRMEERIAYLERRIQRLESKLRRMEDAGVRGVHKELVPCDFE